MTDDERNPPGSPILDDPKIKGRRAARCVGAPRLGPAPLLARERTGGAALAMAVALGMNRT
jgi:hypothetical protein